MAEVDARIVHGAGDGAAAVKQNSGTPQDFDLIGQKRFQRHRVVGVVGAFIAALILPRLGFSLGTGLFTAIVNSTLGAVILLVLIRLVKRA